MSDQFTGSGAPEAPAVDQSTAVTNEVANQAAAVEAKKEEIKRLKKLKLKVDGREFEEELPFEIEDRPEAVDYMKKQLQMSKMAQKRAQEYSTLEKEVRSFVEDLRKNPKKALSDPAIGIDIKKLAAEIIEEEINNSKKSPEQLEKERLEAELLTLKEEREKERKEIEQKEFERIQAAEFQRYDQEITESFTNSDIPKNPYFVKQMANYMMLGLQEGLDVRPQDVLPIVREEFEADLKQLINTMSPEAFEKMVGKEMFNKIRKKNVSKAKEIINNKVKQDTTPKPKAESKEDTKLNYKKFFGI